VFMGRIEFSSFKEFWPFYLSQHLNPVCRNLHYAGTLLALVLFVIFVGAGNFGFIPLAILPGYAFAWVGHFFFERNRPATFKYPLWSFFADFVMLFRFLTGKIGIELSSVELKKFEETGK
jgi:hypothetical protein